MALLSNVIVDICQRAGYDPSEIDVSLITGTVDGFVLSNRSTARSMIEELQKAFLFEGIESGSTIKFVPINQVSSVSINIDELLPMGSGQDAKYLEIGRIDTNELPKTLSINYIAKTADYQQGTQEAIRQIADSGEAETVSVAVVMDNDVARQLVEKMLYIRWTKSVSFSFSLPIKYLRLEPSDVISLVDTSITHNIRILKKQFSGQTLIFEGERIDGEAFTQTITGGNISVVGGVVFDPGDSSLFLLDIPVLRETDNNAGFYIASGRDKSTWRGAQVYRSTDDITYNLLSSIPVPTIAGQALTALPTGPHNYMDRVNTVDVQLLFADQLTSTSIDNLLNSVNSCVLGDELIQFQTATLIGTRTYRLSNLLRGRLGSEQFKGSHVIGERFVMLSPGGNLDRVLDSSSSLGISKYYKPVSVGQDIMDVTASTFTNSGKGLKPYAPCQFKSVQQLSGDFVLTWTRRTRFNGGWLNNSDVPLNEEREEYTLNIYNGLVIVRTAIVSSPTFTYTASMQVSDFGSTQSTISAKVAQNSAIIGAGYYESL
jgi:hypothetical protein